MVINKLSLSGLLIVGSCLSSSAALLADFSGGGLPYAEGGLRTAPVLAGKVLSGGPSGDYYHLLDGAEGSAGNYVSVASGASTAGWQSAIFTMDFRADRIQADGFGVAFLDSAIHGTSGVVKAGTTGAADVEERGQYSNSIGVGFRTFNGTNATAFYNGVESPDAAYSITAGQWGSMEITLDRDAASGDVLLNANTYSGTSLSGTASNVFTDYAIPGVTMEEFRMQISGRTGGASMDLDIDNLSLIVNVPEPATSLLAGLSLLALGVRRRR
ncbi:MAG: PEP-CTERM sorting domain-containing protein [Akkermansiaceae bacterium]